MVFVRMYSTGQTLLPNVQRDKSSDWLCQMHSKIHIASMDTKDYLPTGSDLVRIYKVTSGDEIIVIPYHCASWWILCA